LRKVRKHELRGSPRGAAGFRPVPGTNVGVSDAGEWWGYTTVGSETGWRRLKIDFSDGRGRVRAKLDGEPKAKRVSVKKLMEMLEGVAEVPALPAPAPGRIRNEALDQARDRMRQTLANLTDEDREILAQRRLRRREPEVA
jgi:aminoglycoside phosphotransferase (APT) family kinase protein